MNSGIQSRRSGEKLGNFNSFRGEEVGPSFDVTLQRDCSQRFDGCKPENKIKT